MIILAIDPGHEHSAWVLLDSTRGILAHEIEPNRVLSSRFGDGFLMRGTELGLTRGIIDAVVFEQIECFGMAVGREVFETVFWTGRLFENAVAHKDGACRVERVPRSTVKLAICHNRRANDANIRTELIDRYGGTLQAIGTKKSRGPLYGITSHKWAALALAVTYHDQHQLGERRTG